MRNHVKKTFSLIFECNVNDAIPVNIEKSIFNWSIRTTLSKYDTPSWENYMFKSRYKQKFISILLNLQEPRSNLVHRIAAGDVPSSAIANFTPGKLWPKGPHDLLCLKNESDALIVEKIVPDDYVGMFKCGRCKSKKTTFYQMQTRSADEPMTAFITCLNCDNHWKC